MMRSSINKSIKTQNEMMDSNLMNFLSADLMHNLDNPQLSSPNPLDQAPLQSTLNSNLFQESIFNMEIPGASSSSSSSSSLNAIGPHLPIQKNVSYTDPFDCLNSKQFMNKSTSASVDNLLFNPITTPIRSRSQSGSNFGNIYPTPIGKLPNKPLADPSQNFQDEYFQMAKLMAEISALAPLDNKCNALPNNTLTNKTLTNDKYKTEFCDQIKQRGFCQYGDKCQFAHSKQELREKPRHPKYKTKVCNTFRDTGYCKYGKRCTFIHPTVEEQLPIRESQGTLTNLLQNLNQQQHQRAVTLQTTQSRNFICSNPLNIPAKIRHDSIGMEFSLSPSSFANSFNSGMSSQQDHQRLSVFRSLSCSDK